MNTLLSQGDCAVGYFYEQGSQAECRSVLHGLGFALAQLRQHIIPTRGPSV